MKARQPTILHTIKLQRTYKVCPHKNVTQVISIYTKPVYTICKSHPHSFPPNPSPSALLHGKHNYFLSAHTHTKKKSTSHTHTHTYIHTHTHRALTKHTPLVQEVRNYVTKIWKAFFTENLDFISP